MQKKALHVLLVLLFCLPLSAIGDKKSLIFSGPSIEGVWEIYTDGESSPRSKIVFKQNDEGVIYGRVIRQYHPETPNDSPICKACTGIKKDQMIVGMTIIEGLERKANTEWAGGTILNPDTGEIHELSVALIDSGRKLKIYTPWFGSSWFDSSSWFSSWIDSWFNRYKGSKILGTSLIWEK